MSIQVAQTASVLSAHNKSGVVIAWRLAPMDCRLKNICFWQLVAQAQWAGPPLVNILTVLVGLATTNFRGPLENFKGSSLTWSSTGLKSLSVSCLSSSVHFGLLFLCHCTVLKCWWALMVVSFLLKWLLLVFVRFIVNSLYSYWVNGEVLCGPCSGRQNPSHKALR